MNMGATSSASGLRAGSVDFADWLQARHHDPSHMNAFVDGARVYFSSDGSVRGQGRPKAAGPSWGCHLGHGLALTSPSGIDAAKARHYLERRPAS